MAAISIAAGDVKMTVTLNDSKTAKALLKVLPFTAQANRWGDEVYFDVPLEVPAEDPQARVPSGAVAYWPEGPALCVFFGQTPYSPVNVVGNADGDPKQFARVRSGQEVRVEVVK